MELTILGTILGSLIAALITILIEVLRKPHLKMQIIPPVDMTFTDKPAKEMRAVRIRLLNMPLPRWIKWMYRNPALQCHGKITFHHLDGDNIFGRSMILRWANAPEPIPLRVEIGNVQGLVFDPVRITQIQKMDVYPGESAEIDIAVKLDYEPECYGWSNESYFSEPLWRNVAWRLKQSRYIVKISVLSSGETITGLFRLINDVEQKDFRLEEALPKDTVRKEQGR